MKLTPEEIGKRFAQLRSELSKQDGQNWSQAKVAKEIGVLQSVISKAEQGKGSLTNIIQIMVFFRDKGFSMDWLMSNEADQTPIIPPAKTETESLKGKFKKYIDKFEL